MDDDCFGCQVCLTTFKKISQFKKHVRSGPHQKKMTEVFQKDNFENHGKFPTVVVTKLLAKQHTQPIVGLSLLTFCFSQAGTGIFFYLCHVCEEKCPADNLGKHLFSSDHCSNYFNYTNPNVLTYSWVPSMDMRVLLWNQLQKEVKETGPGRLQILDLPKNLLEKFKSNTYSEVMRTLCENDDLLKIIEAVKPKRTVIQSYQKDSSRMYPLLGMQHLIECICVGPTEKRYYLCTLCNLTFTTRTIIKHVLSFDHIFCYFRAWHPSTLMSKECCIYNKSLPSMMLGYAKQTEEIHGTANTDMKQVRLEPDKFRSVTFTCYAEALKELESITKERLIVSVTPGKKLEHCTQSARSVSVSASVPAARTTSVSASGPAARTTSGTTSVSASGTTSVSASGPAARTTSGTTSVSASGTTSGTAARTTSVSASGPAARTTSVSASGPAARTTSVSASGPAARTTSVSASGPAARTTSVSASGPAARTTSVSASGPAARTTSVSASGPAARTTSVSASGPAARTTSVSASGPAARTTSVSASGPAARTTSGTTSVSASGTTSVSASGPAARTTSVSASGPAARTTSVSTSGTAARTTSVSASGPAGRTTSGTTSGPAARTTSVSASVSASGPAGRSAAGSVARSAALSYTIRCQDCSETFASILRYYQHVSEGKHKKMVEKLFRDARADHYERKGTSLRLGLDAYVKEGLRKNEPVIGVAMVVAFVSTQGQLEPLYICFACKDCFSESSLKPHFESTKHLIHSLLYQNPWRLPFAWEKHLDVKVLQAAAWEEEKQRGPNHMTLKILDMPFSVFWSLQTNYRKVMDSLLQCITKPHLKREVPQCETYSKLEQNERFPLLGERFQVMYDVCIKRDQPAADTSVAFLCLLCEKTLSKKECYAHMFSREHVATFIDRFHPGSLNSSTDAETLFDLAKQAAQIDCKSNVQEIKLDKPIWEPCDYEKAVPILRSAKRRHGNGRLEPPIIPRRKLFPRKLFKDTDKGHVRDNSKENSQMMQRSVKQTSQNPTNNREITSTHSVGSGKNAGKGDHKTPPSPSGKESERRTEVFSKTGSEETKNAGRETNLVIKEEKMEEPVVIKEEKIEEPIQVKQEKERKRPSCMFEKSQDDTCSNEDVEKEIGHKRQRLNSKQDASCKEPQNLPSVTPADKRKSGKPNPDNAKDEVPSTMSPQQAAPLWQYIQMKNREPVIGLEVLFECHCDEHDPIYFCACCSLKIQEKDIISHITGADHQKQFLIGSHKVSPAAVKQLEKDVRRFAALFEQDNGYGEAQVFDLDEEIYNEISKQNFNSAMEKLIADQPQQYSCLELPSTSVTLHAQPEVQSVKDDYQVIAMEIDDDSEDSVAKPSSVTAAVVPMTETYSKTTQATPKSKEDDKMNQIKVSESADNAIATMTVSRSSKDSSSLHVSISGAHATCLHPEPTGKDVKAEIISNTCSAVTTSNKSTSIISKCPARPTSSTSDTTKSRAPNSKLRPTPSSCTTTATTPTASISRENASKCATSTHTKRTAPKPNSCSTSKVDNTSKGSETASQNPDASQSMLTLTYENTGASAKTALRKNSLGPNADVAPKSNAPAAPHPTAMSVRSDGKNQHTGPSHTSMSVRSVNKRPTTEPSHHSASKTKPSEGPRVGLNQMIRVTSEGRQQVYCQLCSVKLRSSGSIHFSGFTHRLNYLKMKFPAWINKPLELLSKFEKVVAAYFAEEEKDQSMQKIEVKIEEYNKLATLPDNEALARLKAMLRKRESRTSTNSAETLRLQVSSTSQCKVSSPDDEMSVSTDNQSEQDKHQLHTLLVQSPETEDRNLAAGQSDGARSLKISETEADDRISDPLPTSHNKNQPDLPDLIVTPSVHDADLAVSNKQEATECAVEPQATVDFTPATEVPAVKMETPQSYADPPTTDSESSGFAQIPDLCQERSDPELQDTQKTSPANVFETDLLPSAASVNTEQQNQSRPSENTEDAPKRSGCSPETRHSASQELTGILKGEIIQGTSHLSTYLTLKGLNNAEIIGLDSVWECRGISRSPFFLCESCSLRLSHNHICDHMVSRIHQDNYVLRKYPQHMEFWCNDDLTDENKLVILKGVVSMIAKRERFKKMDAQVILLRQDSYEHVLAAPFSEALKMVQDIKRELNRRVFCPSISIPQQNDQQPEERQSREESLSTEMQSTRILETDQRCDNEERQKTEKRHFEETAGGGDLDCVKLRKGSSNVDVTTVYSEADSVVSPPPGAGTRHSLQETCSSSCVQPDPRQPASQRQRSTPELQVNQEDVRSESPSSSSVSPKTNQTLSVSARDECFPTRKRLADTSLETLVRHVSNSPQIEDHLPAKRTCSSLQPSIEPASKSTPVNPAATPTILCSKDKDAVPISIEQGVSNVDQVQFEDLISLMKKVKSEKDVSPCKSGPDNTGTTTSCAGNSFESGMETGWDSETVRFKSKMEKKQNRWDAKRQLIKITVKNNPLSSESSERICSAAAPVVSNNESQLINPTTTSVFSTESSFVEGCLETDNLFLGATEAKAVGTMMPATADPSHTQQSVAAQFENVSQIKATTIHSLVSNPNPVQMPQPETVNTVDRQLPINAIITPRLGHKHKKISGSCIVQDRANHPIAHSLPTVATANPSDALAVSGGYGPYSQMAYISNGQVSVFPSYVAGYSTPDTPPVTESLYHHQGYTPNVLYRSQIYPTQEANCFGHLATPISPECVTLELQQLLQQQQQIQQQLMQLLMQQQHQHQHSSWTGAVPEVGTGANEAAYSSAIPLTNPADVHKH